ncbi:MAG: hypothetical protein QOG52_1575, partial [Frankiaceae bacterium]|nr:hypothetical protein [Frankiaceae bacterium]
VLDVGTATRTWPPAIRRALTIRDGGCVALGCDRPPAFTDAHHVVHWADGGPTSVANGALLCRYHHDQVHHGGWALVPYGTGWIALPPHLAAANHQAAANGATLPHLPNPSLLPPPPPPRPPSPPPLDREPHPPDYSVAGAIDQPVP